jgi:hypothetical protein
MNMKTRINRLSRQIEGDPHGECKCSGVQTTFALTSAENPVPPRQDICRRCEKRIPQLVIQLVYDEALPHQPHEGE